MNFTQIIDPLTGKSYSIFDRQGKHILKNFIRFYKSGGTAETSSSPSPLAAATSPSSPSSSSSPAAADAILDNQWEGTEAYKVHGEIEEAIREARAQGAAFFDDVVAMHQVESKKGIKQDPKNIGEQLVHAKKALELYKKFIKMPHAYPPGSKVAGPKVDKKWIEELKKFIRHRS